MESFLFARLANPLQLSEHLGIFVEVQSVNHMKTYSFAKVSARGYLTQADYNNKYIITEDLKIIINVSGRDFEMPQEFFEERGIIAKFTPLTEKNGDMGYQTILNAVKDLLYWDRQGKRCLVCCAFGVNRSRTVIEAFHYAKMGFHIDDEYDEFQNHLICNCMNGFLPPLSKVEEDLRNLAAELAD
jgi:protein-tyrosine phosphatase